MSSRRERWDNGVWAFLFGDIWRKLASLALAMLLWAFLDDLTSTTESYDVQLVQVNAADAPMNPNQLQIEIIDNTLLVSRFENAANGAPIQSVDIQLSGAKHLVEEFQEAGPRLYVRAGNDMRRDDSIEFSIDHVRVAGDHRFQALIDSSKLVPRVIKARLIERREVRLFVDPERVEIPPQPHIPGFEERLLINDWELTPESTLTLRGPGDAIEQILKSAKPLRLDYATDPAVRDYVTGRIALAKTPPANVEVLPDIQFRIRLREESQSITLEVPVVLVDTALPSERRGQFEADRAECEVELHAMGNLLSAIGNMSPEERIGWAKEHALGLVYLPGDFQPRESEDAIKPQIYFPIDGFRADVDYRIRFVNAVRVTEREPRDG